MIEVFRRGFVFLALLLLLAGNASSNELDAHDAELYARAFEALDEEDFATARALAAEARNPLPAQVIQWIDLRREDTEASFLEITEFMEAHPSWPGLSELRRNAEDSAAAADDPAAISAWFKLFPPLTGDGALTYLDAAGENGPGRDFVRGAWVKLDFTPEAERLFLTGYGHLLTRDDHAARLDRLLWDEQDEAAERMLRRVDRDQAALGFARLTLARRKPGVDGAIARVPPSLRDHPGLWYERLRWRRRKGRDEAARSILLDPPTDLVRPYLWARERDILARRALSRGSYSEAHRLTDNHGMERGIHFADAEFLSGWIRLAFLRDNEDALAHFERLYAGVRFSISRSRGAYWAGRAAEAKGDDLLARSWYEQAAVHPTTFYGQTALHRLRRQPPPLQPRPASPPAARNAFEELELVRVVRMLHRLDQGKLLRPFLTRLGMQAPLTEIDQALVAELALEVGRPREAIFVAKWALKGELDLRRYSYPLWPLPRETDGPPEPALLLGLMRQESGFDTYVTSSAGAMGMMQVLPSTARRMARDLGLGYNIERLIDDPDYNIRLGTAFLAELLVQ
ncbi:MAG: transglycosylase SLT domain-containing protein, partial [Alphaproteobacteria bacterium]